MDFEKILILPESLGLMFPKHPGKAAVHTPAPALAKPGTWPAQAQGLLFWKGKYHIKAIKSLNISVYVCYSLSAHTKS